jgi:hypothetical protein
MLTQALMGSWQGVDLPGVQDLSRVPALAERLR